MRKINKNWHKSIEHSDIDTNNSATKIIKFCFLKVYLYWDKYAA